MESSSAASTAPAGGQLVQALARATKVCKGIAYADIHDLIIRRAIEVTSTDACVHVNNIAEDLGLWMSCKLNTGITENKDKMTEPFNERLLAEKERRRASKVAKTLLPPVVQQCPALSRATRAKPLP